MALMPLQQVHATNPGDQYTPFGPSQQGTGTKSILVKIYTDELTEFTAFQNGEIDLTDWPLTPSYISTFCNSSYAQCSPNIGGLDFFDIEFNHASTFWGCAFSFGTSSCGVQIRDAVAHLVDKQAFIANDVNLGGMGTPVDDTPDAVGLKSPNARAWDSLHVPTFRVDSTSPSSQSSLSLKVVYGFTQPPSGTAAAPVVGASVTLTGPASLSGTTDSAGMITFTQLTVGTYAVVASKSVAAFSKTFSGSSSVIVSASTTVSATMNIAINQPEISAFNIAPDPAQTPALNSPDWQAARDHLIASGVTVGTNGDLVASGFTDNNNDGIIDNPPASQVRFYIRSDHEPRLNFGSTLAAALNQIFGATVVQQNFIDIRSAAKIVFSTATVLDWDMYTGGFQLTTPYWDYLYPSFYSLFASNQCGGTLIDQAANYWFYCRPDADPLLYNTEYSATASESASWGIKALDILGPTNGDLPVYSSSRVFAWNTNWHGIIVQQGNGPSNPWTLLNAYSSSPVLPQTLRWGWKQGTSSLALGSATTVWEFNIISEVYDTLLAPNPYNLPQLTSWMANSWKLFLDPTSTQLGYVPPVGTQTTIRFDLRHDIRWHDSVPMTADDVTFSFKECQRLAFSYCFAPTQNLIDVTTLSPYLVDFHFNAKSFTYEINLGSIPIIPRHIWDVDGDGHIDFDKTKNTYDPVATQIYPAGTVLTIKDPTDSANWNNPTLVRKTQVTVPANTYGLVGSGPFVCDQRDAAGTIIVIGGLCSSSGSGSVPANGSFLLHAYDSDFFALKPGDTGYQYFRSTNKFKAWNLADVDNNLRVDTVDVSLVASTYDCRVSRTFVINTITFTYGRTCEKLNVPVSFTASVGGTWTFGDGASITGASVTHAFGAYGTYNASFTPTGGSKIYVTVTPTSRIRVAPYAVNSQITGAATETDWTYWDRGGTAGVIDISDISGPLAWYRVAWEGFSGGTPPQLPTGVWNQITNSATGQGIVSFISVSGMLP